VLSDQEKDQKNYLRIELKKLERQLQQNMEHILDTMPPHEILEMYEKTISDFNVDMNSLFAKDSMVEDRMKAKFGSQTEWEDMAEYARYLKTQYRTFS
jgi:hypothetical protein